MTVILSIPIVLLFLFLAFRCVRECGLQKVDDVVETKQVDKKILYKVFGYTFLFRLLLVGVMIIAMVVSSDNANLSQWDLENKFKIWDAGHYTNLVDLGYDGFIEDGQHLFLVFFPLYVWITRLVNFVIPNITVAGMFVSIVSYSFACCYLYKLVAKLFTSEVAIDTILFISVFPWSFFYGTVMTESLFLLTLCASCYYALEHKWLQYGIWGLLCALTRMSGILVIAVGFIEFFRSTQPFESKDNLKSSLLLFLKKFVFIFMPVLGTGVYLLLNWHVDGDPLMFLTHQKHWNQGFMWFSDVLEYMTDYLSVGVQQWDGSCWFIWLPSIVLFVTSFILLVIASLKREIPVSLTAFAFCYFVINFSLSWLLSFGRYMSCCFVLFMVVALLLKNKPWIKQVLISSSAVLYGVMFVQYMNWAYVM